MMAKSTEELVAKYLQLIAHEEGIKQRIKADNQRIKELKQELRTIIASGDLSDTDISDIWQRLKERGIDLE
jgi:hypothetical protein